MITITEIKKQWIKGDFEKCKNCAMYYCSFNETKKEDLPSEEGKEGNIKTYGCNFSR